MIPKHYLDLMDYVDFEPVTDQAVDWSTVVDQLFEHMDANPDLCYRIFTYNPDQFFRKTKNHVLCVDRNPSIGLTDE